METKDITIVKKTNYTINYEVFKDFVYFEITKGKTKWDPFAMPIAYFNEKIDPKRKQTFNKLVNLSWREKYLAYKKSFMAEYVAGRANYTEENIYDDLLKCLKKGKTEFIFRNTLCDDGFFYKGDKPILKGVEISFLPTDFKDFREFEKKLKKNKKVSNMRMVSTDHWEREGRSESCYEKLLFTYTPSQVEFNKWVDKEKYWTCYMEMYAKKALQVDKYEIRDY